jgi:cardiolipin synthase
MTARLITLPNLITVVRATLIPVIAYALATRAFGLALLLFVMCALGDLLDGFLARRWNQRTRFGAIADPLADKLTMLTVTLMLAAEGLLPGWLAAAVIARDVVIVFGAIAFHFLIHEYEMAPTRLSKVNTALEFSVLTGVLVDAAGIIEITAGLEPAYAALACTILASGLNYVWSWGRRAAKAHSASAPHDER